MGMQKALSIFLLSAILSNSTALFAEEKKPFRFERFNFYLENDFFDRTDKYYTGGVKVSGIYRVDTEAYTYFQIPYLYDNTKYHFFTLSVGQEVYTPEDKTRTIPDPEDHPYAGWLYTGIKLQQTDAKEADTLELQLGIVGPAALGEQAQNLSHKLINNKSSNGWDHQLHNELGIILAYEHRWRNHADELIWNLNADLIPFAGFALGNVHTNLNSGTAVRLGWNIPHDFGNTIMHLAQENGLPAFSRGAERYKPKWAFYLLAAIDLHIDIRNIFLDGNTFRDSPSVGDREYFIAKFTAGLNINYGRWDLALANTRKTREYPLSSNGFSYGTVVISYAY
jgi:hypothetical protein